MRKIITILFLALSFVSYAQIKFAKTEISVEGYCTSPELVTYVTIVNSSQDKSFSWQRVKNERTEGWETAVCDINLCYGVETNEANFDFNPNDSFTFRFYFYPSEIKGEGEAEVVVYARENTSNRDTIKISGSCWGASLQDVSQSFSVYPNPSKNNIYLKGANTDNITYSIYDLLGNIVREGKIQSNQHIDIRNLHVGMYLIKFDVASKTITKVFRKN
ncbi:MAG: hypothetical protein CNE98_05655 [Bacteroidetes bacterium MED-G17]|nr:MAG: hypothetical protein CBB99_07280 [Bacteroidetes bacterium TMED39]PDH52226.1 MAG: hypothetical protein CNE98_05655 [Bacteroidetes bacterium MED-G17]CAI8366317.1 MAG: Uncharacterised protein [Bacteroidetes bacterium MED-G17]|tara:strand:+ start:5007 stop:5660 length:654 start_codon:yes stop_codon:yes gene_type:complete